jgi:hypothetical protein
MARFSRATQALTMSRNTYRDVNGVILLFKHGLFFQ